MDSNFLSASSKGISASPPGEADFFPASGTAKTYDNPPPSSSVQWAVNRPGLKRNTQQAAGHLEISVALGEELRAVLPAKDAHDHGEQIACSVIRIFACEKKVQIL